MMLSGGTLKYGSWIKAAGLEMTRNSIPSQKYRKDDSGEVVRGDFVEKGNSHKKEDNRSSKMYGKAMVRGLENLIEEERLKENKSSYMEDFYVHKRNDSDNMVGGETGKMGYEFVRGEGIVTGDELLNGLDGLKVFKKLVGIQTKSSRAEYKTGIIQKETVEKVKEDTRAEQENNTFIKSHPSLPYTRTKKWKRAARKGPIASKLSSTMQKLLYLQQQRKKGTRSKSLSPRQRIQEGHKKCGDQPLNANKGKTTEGREVSFLTSKRKKLIFRESGMQDCKRIKMDAQE